MSCEGVHFVVHQAPFVAADKLLMAALFSIRVGRYVPACQQ